MLFMNAALGRWRLPRRPGLCSWSGRSSLWRRQRWKEGSRPRGRPSRALRLLHLWPWAPCSTWSLHL